MNEQDFEHIQLARSGPPDLGISFLKPTDWNLLKLPDEPPKFDEPGYFLPLAIVMAPYGTVLFTVAARPAFEDGTVRQWVQFLCDQNKIEITAGEDTSMAGFDGCLVDGRQPSDAGMLKLRLFFFEDGKRLFQVGTIAPEQIWPSVENQLGWMARSFRTDETLGQTAPIAPPAEPTPPKPDPVVTEYHDAPAAETPTASSAVALAGDAGSLREDHPMNARFRDNGIGLVPRVFEINEQEKYALLGAAAISATFKVPLGWHVIDDGKRTLIFDAGGKMQINLDKRQVISPDNAIDAIIAQYTTDQPDVQHLKLNAFGLECVGFRNFKVDGEVLEQVFMFRPSQDQSMAICCRVTASSDDITFATNTAEVVMRDLDETRVIQHPWQIQVETLEKLGQIEAAEELLLASIDHIGAYSSAAHLWEKEVARRAEQGDIEGAKAAAQRAANRLDQYAASATSGGEGTALSHERAQRLEALKAYL